MMDRKKTIKIIVAIVIICAVLGVLGGIFGPDIMYHLKNRGALGPLTREDIDYVTSMSYVSSTMHGNDKNSYISDYLEQDPYLKNIYEGFGFAKEYGSARGHEYTLEDVAATARPHALANCLTCKSANFTKLVNEQGVGVYTMDFNEVYAQLEQKGIGCYNCHGTSARNGGQLDITHSYVAKALGDDYAGIDLSSLTCGQCHIEYYFTPTDKETMMPYSDVAGMTPEAILEYYDTMVMPDGSVGFYDWIQPGTGTKQLKAQHPELETYLQGKHANLLNCADCHMAIEMADDGTVYFSHYLESPLSNPTILSTCVQCHDDTDMVSMVRRIQARVTDRETEVGNKLSDLKDALAAAVAEGKKTEAELDTIRRLHREAQWFFDFCYVENSEGAHNSELSTHCLEVAEARIEEAMMLLD